MRYLMASPTDFGKKKLTGAHRRFLELASKISVNNSLTLVTSIMPTVNKNKNINHICISTDSIWKFPDHVSGMINVYKGCNSNHDVYLFSFIFNISKQK